MSIKRSSIYNIFIIGCCIAVLAACAPVTTGDSNRGHRVPENVALGHDGTGLAGEVSGDNPGIDTNEEQDGRLQDYVEPEPEQTKDQELHDLEHLGKWEKGVPAAPSPDDRTAYDFPVTRNRQVQYYLKFFMGDHRDSFTIWLSRSSRYLPMIQEQLRDAGLPTDLAYLAMIESGFNERAYSQARAVGIWQFIQSTARNYGLEINTYVDERRDPIKSTQAAVAYLGDLYSEFGSWYLAVAAYNAGEGKIRRAIEKYNTNDFWEIAQGRYLKLETKRYVPKLIAAIIIAKNPQKYGFSDVAYEPELAYETVPVPRWTSFKAVALACDMEPEELKQYNTELRKEFTPPDNGAYPFKVPAGRKVQVEKNLPRVQAVVSTGFKTHTVKSGETLARVCRKYGLTKTVILKSNNLRSSGLQPGQRLRIPYQTVAYEMLPAGRVAKGYLAADAADGDFILHKVRPGETVSELARLYNVPAYLIAVWNDIDDISRIRAGQKLVFYVRSSEQKTADSGTNTKKVTRITAERSKVVIKDTTLSPLVQGRLAAVREDLHDEDTGRYYMVQEGDSLWDIARQFDLDLEKLQQLNDLTTNVIYPGDRILLADAQPAAAEFYYQVRSGDSLWAIARKYNVAPVQIRNWNNLHDDLIHPGNKLLLKVADTEEPTVDTFYQVRSGDSLWIIAKRHNISPDQIKRWNNMKDNTIYPGNRLLLKLASGG